MRDAKPPGLVRSRVANASSHSNVAALARSEKLDGALQFARAAPHNIFCVASLLRRKICWEPVPLFSRLMNPENRVQDLTRRATWPSSRRWGLVK